MLSYPLPLHVGPQLTPLGRFPIWDASSSGVPIATCALYDDARAIVAALHKAAGRDCPACEGAGVELKPLVRYHDPDVPCLACAGSGRKPAPPGMLRGVGDTPNAFFSHMDGATAVYVTAPVWTRPLLSPLSLAVAKVLGLEDDPLDYEHDWNAVMADVVAWVNADPHRRQERFTLALVAGVPAMQWSTRLVFYLATPADWCRALLAAHRNERREVKR